MSGDSLLQYVVEICSRTHRHRDAHRRGAFALGLQPNPTATPPSTRPWSRRLASLTMERHHRPLPPGGHLVVHVWHRPHLPARLPPLHRAAAAAARARSLHPERRLGPPRHLHRRPRRLPPRPLVRRARRPSDPPNGDAGARRGAPGLARPVGLQGHRRQHLRRLSLLDDLWRQGVPHPLRFVRLQLQMGATVEPSSAPRRRPRYSVFGCRAVNLLLKYKWYGFARQLFMQESLAGRCSSCLRWLRHAARGLARGRLRIRHALGARGARGVGAGSIGASGARPPTSRPSGCRPRSPLSAFGRNSCR